MQYHLKLHPEITIKSRSVRQRYIKLLEGNVRKILKAAGCRHILQAQWDKIVLTTTDDSPEDVAKLDAELLRIPGINQVQMIRQTTFVDLHDVFEQVKGVWQPQLVNKRFAVSVKRKGEHPFTSTEAARYIGGGLNQHCDTGGVDLKHPEITVALHIKDDELTQVSRSFKGLGGMPIPTQEDVLSLVSGGFDSAVASFQMMRRGARTHFLFFNLGGNEHLIGVRQLCVQLWQDYASSHKVKFIGVNFAPVVDAIAEQVEPGLMGVVLKRMMLRAAQKVADSLHIKALVTGECLGQVASQTLSNLQVIDRVTDKLVIRPLIVADKGDIVDQARSIGIADIAQSIPEYCGAISMNPTVAADISAVEAEEHKLPDGLVESLVRKTNVEDIRSLVKAIEQESAQLYVTDTLPGNSVLVDIRSPEEVDAKPLLVSHEHVQQIPFYRLPQASQSWSADTQYLLYCDRGVMSKLQATQLQEQGLANVGVYRP